jgi:tetratricopeptide (TPR) repeat protein
MGIFLFFALFFIAPWAKASKSPSPKEKKSASQLLKEKAKCESLPQKSVNDLWEVSDCYHNLGDSFKTVSILRKISERDPKQLEAYFTASWLLLKEGKATGGVEEKSKQAEALDELKRAKLSNPSHWEVYTELGDYYFLRTTPPSFDKALVEYLDARKYYGGDPIRGVPRAELGKRAAIEDRIARTAEKLGRKGEAVEASCRALFFDPDDSAAEKRVKALGGSCKKKGVKNPLKGR